MTDEPTLEQRMDDWLAKAFNVTIDERGIVPKGTMYVIDPNAFRLWPGDPDPLKIYVADGEDRKTVMRRLARVDGIR